MLEKFALHGVIMKFQNRSTIFHLGCNCNEPIIPVFEYFENLNCQFLEVFSCLGIAMFVYEEDLITSNMFITSFVLHLTIYCNITF
jgi:hypothetical protein